MCSSRIYWAKTRSTWRVLSGGLCGHGALGVWAGIDVALWDIIGKAKGLPIYKLLATDTEPVKQLDVYASGGEFSWQKGSRFPGPENLITEALSYKAQGYKAFKYRPGAGFGKYGIKPQDLIPYMYKLREAVGPDFGLIQESNCRWSVEQCLQMAPCSKSWVISGGKSRRTVGRGRD
jgi:L-alanine-DL-glutamate epimerase-like enolase superfamily enzyme